MISTRCGHGATYVGADGNEMMLVPFKMPREDAQQTLALTRRSSFSPDGAFELVCLLNKEGCGAGIQADLIVTKHLTSCT